MSRLSTVQACVDLERFDEPALMGTVNCQAARAGEIFSFAYAPSWLQQAEVFAFDPDFAFFCSAATLSRALEGPL